MITRYSDALQVSIGRVVASGGVLHLLPCGFPAAVHRRRQPQRCSSVQNVGIMVTPLQYNLICSKINDLARAIHAGRQYQMCVVGEKTHGQNGRRGFYTTNGVQQDIS